MTHDEIMEKIARAICSTGKVETGEGTCALSCMIQLGSPRKKGCTHAVRVHGDIARIALAVAGEMLAKEIEAPREDDDGIDKQVRAQDAARIRALTGAKEG
ncbi:MAG TPA: hypothetical protein VFS39_04165 [Nitrospira sp.]|nr:hypothetical protein [Nitrospira sp.]